jgi:hypothetical protein
VRCLAVVALFACRADPPEQRESGSAPVASAAKPTVAADVPDVEGAKLLAERRHDDGRVNLSWCIDEHDALDRVKAALERGGWTDVRSRGTGDRIGIAAKRGELRFSATTGGMHEKCAGTFISATVMRVGAITIEPGDKLR